MQMTLKNANEILQRFKNLEDKGTNLKACLARIGMEFMKWEEMNFRRQGSPRWQKLSKTTRDKKGSSLILIDTARMKNSVTANFDGKNFNMGFGVDYAEDHYLGKSKSLNRNIPVRNPLPTIEQVMDEMKIETIASEWFKEQLQNV